MLKSYLKKHNKYLILYLVLSLFTWAISIIIPYVTGKYIDDLISLHVIRIVYKFTFIFLVLNLIQIVLSYFFNIVVTKFKANLAFDLNFEIIEHIKKLPMLYFKNTNSTYLNQRINSDAASVTDFVIDNITNIFIQASTFLISLSILFTINKTITIILLFLIPIYLVIYIVFKRPLYKYSYDMKEKQNNFFAKMNEQLYNIKFIKNNSLFDTLGNQLKGNFGILFNAILKLTKTTYVFSSLGNFVSIFANIILIFLGGVEIVNGKLTIGQFTIINTYFSLLIGSTNYFLNFTKNYQSALVSYTRLIEISNTNKELNGNSIIQDIRTIEFKKVNFWYNEDKVILKEYSNIFKKGNIYAITGKNGTGKSTFISLMIGLFNGYYDGEIYYDEINLKELDLYSIRKNLIGITEQEPILINDSIINNLTYGTPNVSEENILYWCAKLNIYDFILSLHNGLNTNIEEKAANVSGGEKQKISLVRTLIKNPKLLIFDEPTSALDMHSVTCFKEALKEIKQDKIIFLITHNDDIIAIADEIINF